MKSCSTDGVSCTMETVTAADEGEHEEFFSKDYT